MSTSNPQSALLPPIPHDIPEEEKPFLVKYKATILTFPIAVLAFALFFGILPALWFTLIMLCHELGHYAAARKAQIPTSVPIFLPFMGAVIFLKAMPKNAKVEAIFALAGPFGGLLATVILLPIAIYGNFASLQLAIIISAFVHIFNMVPMLPLDGGRILGAVSRYSWIIGAGLLITYGIYSFTPILLLIGVFGALEMRNSFKQRFQETRPAYYDLTKAERAKIFVAYLFLTGLAGGLMLFGLNQFPGLF